MKGFVIQNEYGRYLTKDYVWYEHEQGTDAYVHPNETIGQILETSVNWTVKPARLRAALYNPEGGGTIIYGIPIKVSF